MANKELVNSSAILVGIAERGSDVDECNRSLDELDRLLDTAGGNSVARVIQVKDSFDPRTCIGSGKVKEISEMCQSLETKLVIFDFELTPAQIRNLENDIGNDRGFYQKLITVFLDLGNFHAGEHLNIWLVQGKS